eukprot:1536378-Rhodomonas_salina.2
MQRLTAAAHPMPTGLGIARAKASRERHLGVAAQLTPRLPRAPSSSIAYVSTGDCVVRTLRRILGSIA